MDIPALVPVFGNVIWTILSYVVALSVIVAVHEFGHYIVGRWSGIHADVFSLGFGPVVASRVDRRGTVWQIAAVPLGGYVKFRGDDDPASATASGEVRSMSARDRRSTMHGAPLWARTATVAAGPAFNFALSIVIFALIFMFRGVVAEPLTVGELRPMPTQQELARGDVLLQIEGRDIPSFDDEGAFAALVDDLPTEGTLRYTIRRSGREMVVDGPYPYPAHVSFVSPLSAAAEAGLQEGDTIIAVDGTPIYSFEALRLRVEGSEGAPLALRIWRDGAEFDVDLTPRQMDEPLPGGGFQTVYRVGIAGELFFEPATTAASPLSALSGGVQQTVDILTSSLSGLWHMVTGAISSCNLSGPIGIAEISGEMARQGVLEFVWLIAMLSTAVGLLNLFPVPVLDGGHLVFYAYEAVAGRPPSDRALKVLMAGGLALILSLMVFALGNDLFCP